MPNAGTRSTVQSGILLVLVAAHLTSQAQNNFEWKDASGKTRNRSDLEEILKKHTQWHKLNRHLGSQADLSRADLTGADLTRADLAFANL